MATYSSVLAWKIPWTEEPGGLQSMWSQRDITERLSMSSMVKGCVCVCVCCVQLFATPWTVPSQVLLSIKFSRQNYWSGLPFPSPQDLPYPGIKPWSPALQADSSPSEPPGIVLCTVPTLRRRRLRLGRSQKFTQIP